MDHPSASVVLVEDSAPYAILVGILLDEAVPGGVEVRHHETLRGALADLRVRDADCVLLDLGLPDANGLEGLATLRAAGVRVPVVVLSGDDDPDLAVRAIEAGAQDYLVKGQERPPAVFVRAIRFAIARGRAPAHGGRPRRAEDARAELRAAEQELRHQQEDVLAISELARDASVLEDAEGPLCRGGRTVLGADFVVLFAAQPGGRLGVVASDGAALPERAEVSVDTEASVAARAFRERARVEIDDVQRHPGVAALFATATQGRTVVFEPLLRGPEVLGVLAVGWRERRSPLAARTSTVVRLLASELATALERRRLLAQLRDLARTDPLTGLANRRLWDERLAAELARAARHESPLCVAAIDLDRFKPYNDRFGHQAGDRLLQETAAAWSEALRTSDLLSRIGGDEFALVLPDCDVECARPIVVRLQELTPGREEGVGCSAGIALWQPDESATALLARADEALYAAKAAGRGGIAVA